MPTTSATADKVPNIIRFIFILGPNVASHRTSADALGAAVDGTADSTFWDSSSLSLGRHHTPPVMLATSATTKVFMILLSSSAGISACRL
jgi:hypothetical protein